MADDEWRPVTAESPQPAQTDEWRPVTPVQGTASVPSSAQLALQGLPKFPAYFVQGITDLFEKPGKAVSQGLTPEEEIGFGVNTALATMGAGTEFPFVKGATVAPEIANVAKAFKESVNEPITQQLAAEPNIVPKLQEARELGVIGPEKPEPTWQQTPHEQAQDAVPPRTLSAARTPDEMKADFTPREAPADYEARFKEWVSKIDSTDDVANVIEKAGAENNYFPAARAGEIPAAHVAEVAEAAGLDPLDIDRGGLTTRFDSDGKVRAVIQALRQTTQDFVEASAKAAAEPSEENAAASMEAELRQRHVLEYTLGARADSSRSLSAWKDALRETERARAIPKIKADEAVGKAPTGLADLVDAASDLRGNLSAPTKGKLGLQKLIDAAERLVTAEPKAGIPKEPLAPDVAALVDQAKKTLQQLKGGGPKSDLEKLVNQAEREVANTIKQKQVRKPADALPPEWQALVDKADFVTKRFGGVAKGEEAAMLLARSGRTAAEQAELARSIEGLTPNQVARVLDRLRKNPNPHWMFWTVQQALISGLITHTKYALVNIAQTFMDRVIAPEIAAVIDRARGGDKSLLAPLRAVPEMISSVPDAVEGFRQAFKTGQRVPLASELKLAERGEPSPQTKGAQTPYGPQQQKINFGTFEPGGIAGRIMGTTPEGLDRAARVIGIPGRSANALHTFFKILNERASLASKAFEAAEKEQRPGSDQFWERYQYHLDNPKDDVLRQAVDDGYSGTFMEKLGPQMENFARLIRNTPFKWLIFFTHIPLNIIRAGIKNSPLAVLNMLGETKMGQALKGELGNDAQNLAWSHAAIGTAMSAYFIHKALSGTMTPDYPTDPKERNRWRDLGIQSNSMKINDQWISLDRLGPYSMVAKMAANYAHIFQRFDFKEDGSVTNAALALSLGTAKVLADDVGFETIRNIINVMENPKEAARFAAYQLSSYAQPVSLVTQQASFMDPYMRVANNFIDGYKYHIPLARETLLPKRDPIYGEPVPNPGYHGILRGTPAALDPVKAEIDRVGQATGWYPTAPQRVVNKTKLTDEQYDRYEATAGPYAKELLSAVIRSQRYQAMPPDGRAKELKAWIGYARASARSVMQGANPALIQQGIDARTRQIIGQ